MSQEPLLDDFGGTVRLFPLPNLVLFPQVVQPLHVFELRYRELLADALADDRLIAMALLRPGWEEDYHREPAIHPVVCIGHVEQDVRLPDGRSNLLLRGLGRARICEEVAAGKLYRVARVDLLADVPVACASTGQDLRDQLGRQMRAWFASRPATLEQVERLLASTLSLSHLCDIFAYTLPLELPAKQLLLEEVRVETRVRQLLAALHPPAESSENRRFPPDFSSN